MLYAFLSERVPYRSMLFRQTLRLDVVDHFFVRVIAIHVCCFLDGIFIVFHLRAAIRTVRRKDSAGRFCMAIHTVRIIPVAAYFPSALCHFKNSFPEKFFIFINIDNLAETGYNININGKAAASTASPLIVCEKL